MSYQFPADTHWRDSARNTRFFLVDARAAFPIFLFLMHIRIWTAILVLISTVFFGIIEHFGFTVPIFFRWLRTMIAGNLKLSQTPWRGYDF